GARSARPAGFARRPRQDLAADGTGALVLVQQPGLAVVRRGPGVPGAVDITVTPVGDQRLWPRRDGGANQERQIAARRAARNDDAIRVDLEQPRSFLAEPAEGVADVLGNGRHFDLGCEPVIERDEDEALALAQVEQLPGYVAATADNERSAMNPDDRRAHLVVAQPINVSLDGDVIDGLVGVGCLAERLGGPGGC